MCMVSLAMKTKCAKRQDLRLTRSINWAFQHLPIGDTFLSLIAPVFEHDFQVVYFSDEEDSKVDKYFTDQFSKEKGEWMIVEYGGKKCEFCDELECERVESKEILEGMLEEVAVMDGRTDEKRYRMYRRYTALKYGGLGRGVRRKLDECVAALILSKFPLEAGKRKRGYKAVAEGKDNNDT